MYVVTNLSVEPHVTFPCDAIETVVYDSDSGAYIPSEDPDGFRALIIVHDSPSQEHYTETLFAYEGHTLSGAEPYGSFEWVEQEEEEESVA